MRKKFYKITATMLAAVMTLSPMTAFAAEVTTQELGQGTTSGQAEVVYDTSGEQSFTVVIPKKIVLGSNKQAEYDITVKGDVAQGSKVKVNPRDDVDDREGTNFIMTAEKTGDSKNVDVTQDDVYWNYSEIVVNGYNGTAKPGNVDGSELTLGIWQGDLTFLINFEDEYNQLSEEDMGIAPLGAINDYTYTLDGTDKIVTLKHYIGNSKNVRVYENYRVGNDIYKTKIANGSFDEALFDGCYEIETISFDKIDTSDLTSTHSMFDGCRALTSLDISNLDTSNVVDMCYMFAHCDSITSFDLNNFNTSSVANMEDMFTCCPSLTSLDLSNFDTSSVTSMKDMFAFCPALISVDLSSFTTNKVEDMSYMFNGCNSLKQIDLSNFDTSNVTDMWCMFKNCSSLTSLDLSSFDTSNVTDMEQMFYGCSELKTIYVNQNKWRVPSSKDDMFTNCGTNHVTYK